MAVIVEHVGSVASFIGSMTVVGGALLWIYNKLISAPREKKRQKASEKNQREMIELITEKNKPLNESIKRLNELLDESQLDRKKLNKLVASNTELIECHEERLDNLSDRVIVLEVKNGIQKIAYREEYGKGDSNEQMDPNK